MGIAGKPEHPEQALVFINTHRGSRH